METVKECKDGSKLLKFNDVEFWVNRNNVIMYIPSGNWTITAELVNAGLAIRKSYQNLYNHVDYILK